MAKDLKKFTQEFESLKKQAEKISEEYKPLTTNRQHFAAMFFEASEQITREVAELKKQGKTGTKLSDFAGEKEIKTILAEVANFKKQIAGVGSALKALHANGTKIQQKIVELGKEIHEEVEGRDKKKDRKVFAVDSKSLPELKKLDTEVSTYAVDFKGDVLDNMNTESEVMSDKKIDDLMEKAVTAAPEARAERDEKAMDQRGLDVRILGANTKRAQALRADVRKQIGVLINHLKKGERDDARDVLTKVVEIRGELQKIAEQYARTMKGMNKYDLESMKQSKDGKTILAATELIAKLDEEAGGELDVVLRKVKI